MNKSLIISIVIILVLAGAGFYFLQSPDTEKLDNPTSSTGPNPTAKCFVGGCSGQVCSDKEGIITTCEYREEYGCYKEAKCERQASGQCGWTETTDFKICMNAIVSPGANLK